MDLGKRVRLNRLFSHPSGRLAAVAVDHYIGYGFEKLPPGLRRIGATLERLVAGKPDSITMHLGIAANAWPAYAGKIPFILQSTIARFSDDTHEQVAEVEDAVRLGADAFACCTLVRGQNEGAHLTTLARCVREAARYDMPVVVHSYPRVWAADGKASCSYEPDHIAWAVRTSLECGADVIKVPFCNDTTAYAQIVSETPVPIVAAGGPTTDTFEAALAMLREVVKSGARGAVIGRNVWSAPDPAAAVVAIKQVIHDGKSPAEALSLAGLTRDGTPVKRA
jgi:class I fructose-bisphosphate aldolase